MFDYYVENLDLDKIALFYLIVCLFKLNFLAYFIYSIIKIISISSCVLLKLILSYNDTECFFIFKLNLCVILMNGENEYEVDC